MFYSYDTDKIISGYKDSKRLDKAQRKKHKEQRNNRKNRNNYQDGV